MTASRYKDPEAYKQYLRDWRKRNPEKQKLYRQRHSTPERNWERHIKATYGFTKEDYERTLKEQEGLCAICRRTYKGRGKRFHVDHDHNSGLVRGLLCHYCNILIGVAKESEEILMAAISYLGSRRGVDVRSR